MTALERQKILSRISLILDEFIEVNSEKPMEKVSGENKPLEMLTIRECSEQIHGLSEHTIRKLVFQGKIPHVRAGEGKNGKILISREALLDYFKCGS